MLLKFPSDQRIEPHSQSADAGLVVLRGTFEVGNGNVYDAARLQAVNPGEVVKIPAQAYQFGHAKTESIVLLYGVGPLSVNWASAAH